MSLTLIAWHSSAEISAQRITAVLPGLANPPIQLVRAGLMQSRPLQPRVPARQVELRAALWRQPLNARLFDRVYVDTADRADPAAARNAALLARLGWRDTSSSQNLLLHYALTARYSALIDRAESLTRRHQSEATVFQFLGAVEATPAVRQLIVTRLRAHVPWRDAYLGFDPLLANPQFRDARLRTLRELLASGDRVDRQEIDGLVLALVAAGQPAPAYRLWADVVGHSDEEIYDQAFRRLTSASVEPATIPFEWQLESAAGHSATASGVGATSGVDITWDGRDVPTLMSQLVPVPSGRHATLEIVSDRPAEMAQTLQPIFTCGGQVVPFSLIGSGDGAVRYVAPPLPPTCRFATLSLAGRPLDDARNVTLTIRRIRWIAGS